MYAIRSYYGHLGVVKKAASAARVSCSTYYVMGDIQEYFIHNGVKNFYSVSISGYHIAEAGANPITQLAFTLANAFTYCEVYRA